VYVFSSSSVLLLCAAITPSLIHAQSAPPDAGALRQQLERQQLDKPKENPDVALQAEQAAPLQLPEGTSLTVQRFRFAGNTLLGEEQLLPVVQQWLNHSIGFADLQRATAAVANTYRAAGWIAVAFLPQQDVTDGSVIIQITESQFGGAHIKGAESTRLKSAVALEHVQQHTGQPLSAPVLDRSLLLINDLPGVSVSGALSPGALPGETELLLGLSDDALIDGTARMDTGGARFTGEQRMLLAMGINSPLRIGDRIRADLQHSKGSDYARLGYTLPVGAQGWQVGVNGSYFEYELIGDEFAALDGGGRSTSIGATASYPLLRSRLRNLYLTLAADQKKFRTNALDVRQSDYTIASLNMGLAANLYDNWGGGGANSFNLAWVSGQVRQHELNVGENPAVDGHFDKIVYGVSREQVLTSTLSLHGAVNGQYSREALDSSERYYLGGPSGVRAYPVNDGGGSRAVLGTLELRWLLHPAFSAAAFNDWGHVTNPGDELDYNLRGHGVSLQWLAPLGIQVEATYASRDGRNRNVLQNGAYQDGSRQRDRWWLQASMSF